MKRNLIDKSSLNLLIFLLSFSLDLSAQHNERNYFSETWEARVFEKPEAYVSKELFSEVADAEIIIEVKDTIAKVLPTQFGVNTTFRNGYRMATDGIRMPMYKKANLGSYRFPAGSGSNIYFWDGNVPDEFLIEINAINAIKDQSLKPSDFVRFIKYLDAEATVVVNYFYARYGVTPEGTREARVKQAALYAAGFVRKMNIELKAGIKNWEVGNECYGSWEEGYNVNGSIVTGKEYGEDFRVFAEEMKKVDSTIKVGAVLYTKDTEWNPEVVREVQDHADFFIIHDYFTAEKDANIPNILGSVGKITENMDLLRDVVEKETDKTLEHFPVALTEFNCRGPHTTTMTNGMFVTQILGEVMKNKIGLSTLWVSEWKWKADLEPKAFLAVGDPAQKDYTARPMYMPYHFYGKCFGDIMVNTNTQGAGVNAYASTFSSGQLGLVIVNTNGSKQAIKLDTKDFNAGEVFWYEVYANTIEPGDKKFYINGKTGSTVGGGPENFDEIAPYQAVYTKENVLIVPAYSINFFVIEEGLSVGISPNNLDLKIYPNPVGDKLKIKTKQDVSSYVIYNSTGIPVLKGGNVAEAISISNLTKGHYILKITIADQNVIRKFVKI